MVVRGLLASIVLSAAVGGCGDSAQTSNDAPLPDASPDTGAAEATPDVESAVDSPADTDAANDSTTDVVTDGKPEGSECKVDAECAAGLLCCYPCGVYGCKNKCIKPGSDGMCPRYP